VYQADIRYTRPIFVTRGRPSSCRSTLPRKGSRARASRY
jgi:hypothetical protein